MAIPGVALHQCSPPALHEGLVERTGIIDRLASASTPVVLVTAGAGFGKTTAVRQWTLVDERPLAWLTLAEYDNDPVVFARALVCCLAGVMPIPEVVESVREPTPRLVDRVLPLLESAIAKPPEPFVLVMDDLETVSDSEVMGHLDRLLDSVAPGSQVVLASRSVPPVHEVKRLMDGGLTRIGVDELALTADEAEAMLTAMAPGTERDIVEAVVARIDGWPAGLQLAGIALGQASDKMSVRDALSGESRLLAEYFEQEVLRGIEAEDLGFMIRSSVLERLTGESCDHVMGESGSAVRLERLVSSGNTLVLPLEEPGLYRYHALFRETLLAHLRRTDPGEEAALRRRAIDWHLAHGEGKAAVAQSFVVGDPELAAEVIILELVPVIFRGEIATLERWLQGFPSRAEHHDDLRLALSEGWLSLMRGRRSDLEQWLDVAESAPRDQALPEAIGSADVAIATLRMVSSLGGVKNMMENARIIRDQAAQSSPFWAVAWVMEGIAQYLTGITPDIREALAAGEFHSRGVAVPHSVALAQVGYGECRYGNPAEGRRLIQEAVDEVNANALRDYSMMPVVYCALAYSEAQRGDVARSVAAAEHAGGLIDMTVGLVDPIHIQTRLMLAEAALLRADTSAAATEVAKIAHRLSDEPDAALLHDWFADIHDRIETRTEGRLIVDLTPAEHRVLEQLPTHLSLAEIADHLYVSRNTVKSHTLSVYRKLSVSGRSQAVEKAEELGLLDRLTTNGTGDPGSNGPGSG